MLTVSVRQADGTEINAYSLDPATTDPWNQTLSGTAQSYIDSGGSIFVVIEDTAADSDESVYAIEYIRVKSSPN